MATKVTSTRAGAQDAIDAGTGILRLEPCWVPRTFMIPGRRLRLHPDDLYALGAHRGGINERWFSSTTHASNGPGTPDDEGLSYVRMENGARVLFKSLVDEGGDLLLGSSTMQREGGWNLLCKFFDNLGAIPHHLHQSDAFAKLVGQKGKPEAYYFPPQYNQIENAFPFTFMGLEPGHDERRRAALPRKLEQGRQRHPVSLPRVPAAARNGLADQSRHSPRAGIARHLRAAGEQRRLRDVPVARRRARRRSQPADEGRQTGISRRPRLSRQHARLGRERESGVRDEQSRVSAACCSPSRKRPRPVIASSGCATARRGIRRRN